MIEYIKMKMAYAKSVENYYAFYRLLVWLNIMPRKRSKFLYWNMGRNMVRRFIYGVEKDLEKYKRATGDYDFGGVNE